jgi:hypothetical protein
LGERRPSDPEKPKAAQDDNDRAHGHERLAVLAQLSVRETCQFSQSTTEGKVKTTDKGDETCIVGMPGRAIKVPEKGSLRLLWLGVLPVQALWQDANLSLPGGSTWVLAECRGPKIVLCGKEHGTGREHDGWVISAVAMVECDEIVYDKVHERMARRGEHEIVGNADRDGAGDYDVEPQQRSHRPLAPDIEIHVDTAIVVQNKVALGRGPRDVNYESKDTKMRRSSPVHRLVGSETGMNQTRSETKDSVRR